VKSSSPLSEEQRGANESVILEFEDGTKGIFKPVDGQQYGDIRGEVLAYELSEQLGWELVPHTTWMTHEGTKGTVQRWVEGSKTLEERGEWLDFTPGVEKSAQMEVFDALLGNGDRHEGNILVDSGGKLWAIDNGGAFGFEWRGAQEYSRPWLVAAETKPTAEHKAVCKVLSSWGKTGLGDFTKKVRTEFGDETAKQFEKNYYELVGWGT